ncbi:7653_t:CDS:2, partial [Gigaspora margarita]
KYHGSLDDITKNVNLDRWKNRSVKIMCATNTFGMGINVADIRLVIYTTFSISLDNFVQEIGRAARDGKESKSILFFSQADIRNLLYILTGGRTNSYESLNSITDEEQVIDSSIERQQQYLAEGTHKILEMVTICENDYQCQQQLIYNSYHWPNDSSIPEYQKCDYCKRRINDYAIWYNVQEEVLRILWIVDQLLKSHYSQESTLKYINRDIVGDVFITAKNKEFSSKGLSTLNEYGKKDKKSPITSKHACLRLYDQLVLEGLIQQNVILKPLYSGSTTLVLVYEIIGISSNAINLATSKE